MSALPLPPAIEAVVIGASTGGVEALTRLLPALPADLAASVFVVLHLPRSRTSLLAEIFGRVCALPVREVLDKDPVLPGTVYVAPPNYHLLLDRGPQLALSMDEPVEYSRPSITVLFESAAALYGPRLLGVILTGAGADGADGLAAVQRAGGRCVVQLPADASVAQMPASALQRTSADFVLTLEDMMTLFRQLPRSSA